jgi:hypothetical protein
MISETLLRALQERMRKLTGASSTYAGAQCRTRGCFGTREIDGREIPSLLSRRIGIVFAQQTWRGLLVWSPLRMLLLAQ